MFNKQPSSFSFKTRKNYYEYLIQADGYGAIELDR